MDDFYIDDLYIVVEYVNSRGTLNFRNVVYGNTSLERCIAYVDTRLALDFVNSPLVYKINKVEWDMLGHEYGQIKFDDSLHRNVCLPSSKDK